MFFLVCFDVLYLWQAQSVLILELVTCRCDYIGNYNWKMNFQSEKPNTLIKFSQCDTKYECLDQQNKEGGV